MASLSTFLFQLNNNVVNDLVTHLHIHIGIMPMFVFVFFINQIYYSVL